VGDSIHRICKILTIAVALLLLCSVASATTLNVGPKEKYKTIQKAVNAAKNGDTIKVASGTYHEHVKINKWSLQILGTNYPKVDGFEYYGGSGTINGFSIQKSGVSTSYAGGGLIRNNYFYNCGIELGGATGGADIVNNQIFGGTICLIDTKNSTISGTTVSNLKCGLFIGDSAKIPTVKGCTFKNCGYAVYFWDYDHDPGKLPTFSGNKYIGNKVNFGWRTKTF
jgi:parallel beta-helix repeat protein